MSNCLPKWLHQFIFPSAIYEDSNFSTSSPALVLSSIKSCSCGCLSRCDVASHLVSTYPSWMTANAKHRFMGLWVISTPYVEECLFSVIFLIYELLDAAEHPKIQLEERNRANGNIWNSPIEISTGIILSWQFSVFTCLSKEPSASPFLCLCPGYSFDILFRYFLIIEITTL